MLTKVLVANRGELAARVVRTCAELGIASVAVHSDSDEKALYVRLADEAVRLPGTSAAETYLHAERLVAAAVERGADAVHPGYGFLSENAHFAERVEQAGLTFIGPPPAVIAALGDKMSARALAVEAGVPVVPGIDSAGLDAARLQEFGATHGWPLVIKAARGGGGRGMRVLTNPAEAETMLASARSEALAAFGEDTVYAERYLDHPRHIEIQVFADAHGQVIWCGDRDCSVQRHHQKLVEEAPAPGITDAVRHAMGDAAVRLTRQAGYRGAGTVEFLVEGDDFVFLEMNTRIQVEHPVTELVTGTDLIREQLRVAGGGLLSQPVSGTSQRGHAIECRINAEDPGHGFHPGPGRIRALTVPWRPGVRLDTGYLAGDEIPSHYDSLIAKLLVWGPTRDIALRRMRDVLTESEVGGVPTTMPAAAAVLAHPDFDHGGVPTHWFEHIIEPTLVRNDHAAPASPDDEAGAWIAGRFHRIPRTPQGSASGESHVRRRSAPNGAAPQSPTTSEEHRLSSPMQGTVTAVHVAEGDAVPAGHVVATVEAMKMQYQLTAAADGVIKTVYVHPEQSVAAGEPLIVIAHSPATDGKDIPDAAL